MDLLTEIEKLRAEGYSEENAEARLCQDIVLQGIAGSSLSRNITIKGGVVMRNLSKSMRRATQDVDIDFIRYSLDDDSIERFISRINTVEGVHIKRIGRIEELKHQDYKGKRIQLLISDDNKYEIKSKMDIGVHKDLTLLQNEYCFDICFMEEGASLLMNSPAQMIAEKLKSLVRFGASSTRYKDIFDIYYLLDKVDVEKLKECIENHIIKDETLKSANSLEDIAKNLEKTAENEKFIQRVKDSKKNWLDIGEKEAFERVIEFIKSLI